jgi:hypothetical protein
VKMNSPTYEVKELINKYVRLLGYKPETFSYGDPVYISGGDRWLRASYIREAYTLHHVVEILSSGRQVTVLYNEIWWLRNINTYALKT